MKQFRLKAKIVLLILTLCICTGAWADTDVLFDKVQAAVKENLAITISDKAELEELRIVKGAEYFGGGNGDMTVREHLYGRLQRPEQSHLCCLFEG